MTIELRRLAVTFHPGTALATRALRGVDLVLRDGELVTVIGGNGAGKSTLLGVVAGAVRPTAGSVLIGGVDVTAWPATRRARLVGRVFQDPLAGSCAELTVEENLALAAARGRRRGLALAVRPASREAFRERLAALGLGLEDRLRDRMGLLSGGQRQAVSLLMATQAPLEILLLDEHIAALDPRMAGLVLELTEKLARERRVTTLMITHSMQQALAVGDRLVMLHEGTVCLDIAGPDKARLTVADLLAAFRERRGEVLAEDALLLD